MVEVQFAPCRGSNRFGSTRAPVGQCLGTLPRFPELRVLNQSNYQKVKMRWLLTLGFLTLLSLVRALSSSGNRLLVVIEEGTEKEKYSQFWGDLEGAL